jgi:hypothetical protein
MNVYIACVSDTLVRLIEEAKECELVITRSDDQAGSAYEQGRLDALTQSLHTWKNQIETFGLLVELGQVGQGLVDFCRERGLP